MSSGNFSLPTSAELFVWSDDLDTREFIFATYLVATGFSAIETALGMAMEQSAATSYIKNYVTPDMMDAWAIRVRRAEISNRPLKPYQVTPYFLPTEVYAGNKAPETYTYEIELAIPNRLVGGKPAQLLNVVIGELPRLGYITAMQLIDIEFPPDFGCGPAFGQQGILNLLDKTQGPLLCRSMRPGLGLSLDVMVKLHHDVLLGGFHLVKDDELLYFPTNDDFRRHVQAVVAARDEAIAQTGERKLYVANLLCEPDELEARWEIACEAGVDAVLVAPFIQGLGTLLMLARRKKMPLLAHNTFSDLMYRHTSWGIDEAVAAKILRELGADWVVMPGDFGRGEPAPEARAVVKAAIGDYTTRPAMMPILQGGKRPSELASYHAAVDNPNFMLIVASWVDGHPEGLINGARIFRNAVDAY
ncbi:MAG TPA: RuBisCO large subunit C-terminal-like domain-containing protein [Cellvibrio sp.]